jgi:hypothetical protein
MPSVMRIVVFGALFCLIFIPAGFVLRLFGWDPLALRRPDAARSRWRLRPERRRVPVGN